METISLLGMLGICSVEDIRRKQVGITAICLAGILGLVYHMFFQRITLPNLLAGAGLGVLVYATAVLSGEKIGKGDALILIVTGIYLGFWRNLILFWLATVLAGLGGMSAIVFLHKKKTDTLPFVPYLSIAVVLLLLIEAGGGIYFGS